jgi:hypothetical protein
MPIVLHLCNTLNIYGSCKKETFSLPLYFPVIGMFMLAVSASQSASGSRDEIVSAEIGFLWRKWDCGKIGFLPNGQMHVSARVSGTNLCEDINCYIISPSFKLVSKGSKKKKKSSSLRSVMEGSMIFCPKNILEHSPSFYGDYKKRCILTTRVSQIL